LLKVSRERFRVPMVSHVSEPKPAGTQTGRNFGTGKRE
jgi:hypothetical protein